MGDDEQFSHVEAITDGDEPESLMWEPGRTATLLAHNDLAVVGPGGAEFKIIHVNENNRGIRSFLYANGVAGSLSNHLLGPNPRGC